MNHTLLNIAFALSVLAMLLTTRLAKQVSKKKQPVTDDVARIGKIMDELNKSKVG